MKSMNLEILVFVKAFDEVFSNTVMSRNSYFTDEIIWGGKFRIMYHPNDDKTKTVLDLALIDEYDRVIFLHSRRLYSLQLDKFLPVDVVNKQEIQNREQANEFQCQDVGNKPDKKKENQQAATRQ